MIQIDPRNGKRKKNVDFHMNNKIMFETIRQFAINNSELDDIHGFPHVERVYKLCLDLGKKLDANLIVLKTAALLHDIGRKEGKDKKIKKNHAELSAELAYRYLSSQNFIFPEKDLKNIIHSIRSHSFSNNISPRTLEAKIVSDADKLDAIGAIGLYRTIGFTVKNKGNINDVIDHLEGKIIKLRDKLFLDISKEIAEKRQKIVLDFYKEIKNCF
ncbi:MAG: HD domain-containing protein [Promethearchaeota archaeon]